MSIDINQFFEAFYEECLEALDTMEAGLLEIDTISSEAIHGLFRAAHSIKGGAGTFGFTAITEFTHTVETLLDQIRYGTQPANKTNADILLEACDCIRMLLDSVRNNSEVNSDRIAVISQKLQFIIDSKQIGSDDRELDPSSHEHVDNGQPVIYIQFSPHKDAFKSGLDPIHIFQTLSDLGSLQVTTYIKSLPVLDQMDAESCHLSWDLYLHSCNDRSELDEILEWINDDCEILVSDLSPDDSGTVNRTDAEQMALDTPEAGKPIVEQPPEVSSEKTSSIRVNTTKIDQLINMVGELVITQSMLNQIGDELKSDSFIHGNLSERLRDGLDQLERHTRELQENVMGIRMVPISYAFSRFPRLVHDLSTQLDKEINLNIRGETTEIDKTLIERLNDPLIHMIRNAADHGIEPSEKRAMSGKPPVGSITLEAQHKGGNVVIEITDDGCGLDAEVIRAKAVQRGLITTDANLNHKQALELIFEPGFSTAEQVSDLSGRGVGMDVVRNNVQALGGDIEVDSTAGTGTSFRIIMPLTLAILDGQTVKIGNDLYVIPLAAILESVQLRESEIRRPADSIELFKWRGEQLPLIRLHKLFDTDQASGREDRGLVVIVEGGGYRAGLTVTDLLAQQQVVIKSLDENFLKIDGFSGATILGDGTVALILDIAGIIKLASGPATHHRQPSMEH